MAKKPASSNLSRAQTRKKFIVKKTSWVTEAQLLAPATKAGIDLGCLQGSHNVFVFESENATFAAIIEKEDEQNKNIGFAQGYKRASFNYFKLIVAPISHIDTKSLNSSKKQKIIDDLMIAADSEFNRNIEYFKVMEEHHVVVPVVNNQVMSTHTDVAKEYLFLTDRNMPESISKLKNIDLLNLSAGQIKKEVYCRAIHDLPNKIKSSLSGLCLFSEIADGGEYYATVLADSQAIGKEIFTRSASVTDAEMQRFTQYIATCMKTSEANMLCIGEEIETQIHAIAKMQCETEKKLNKLTAIKNAKLTNLCERLIFINRMVTPDNSNHRKLMQVLKNIYANAGELSKKARDVIIKSEYANAQARAAVDDIINELVSLLDCIKSSNNALKGLEQLQDGLILLEKTQHLFCLEVALHRRLSERSEMPTGAGSPLKRLQALCKKYS